MEKDRMANLRDRAEAETAASIEDAIVSEEEAVAQMRAAEGAPEPVPDSASLVPLVGKVTKAGFNAIARRRKWEPLTEAEERDLAVATAELLSFYMAEPTPLVSAWMGFCFVTGGLVIGRLEAEPAVVLEEVEPLPEGIGPAPEVVLEEEAEVPPLTAAQRPGDA